MRLGGSLPPLLLQGLGLRQGGELALEGSHLEVLGKQAGQKHQDAAEKTKFDEELNPKMPVTQNTSCGKAATTMSSMARNTQKMESMISSADFLSLRMTNASVRKATTSKKIRNVMFMPIT